jgi:hypothetical protein
MLTDFLRYCLHHGFVGWALLPLAGWTALTAVLAVVAAVVWGLDGVKWIGGRWGEWFRRTVASPERPADM